MFLFEAVMDLFWIVVEFEMVLAVFEVYFLLIQDFLFEVLVHLGFGSVVAVFLCHIFVRFVIEMKNLVVD